METEYRTSPSGVSVNAAQMAAGEYVASLAPWNVFVTLTHRPREVEDERAFVYVRPGGERSIVYGRSAAGYSVAMDTAQRRVKSWFHRAVRRYDSYASMWAETELHKSGAPHHHLLLAVRRGFPLKSVRQAWWEECGYARAEWLVEPVKAATYAAKYAVKETGVPPIVYGIRVRRAGSE